MDTHDDIYAKWCLGAIQEESYGRNVAKDVIQMSKCSEIVQTSMFSETLTYTLDRNPRGQRYDPLEDCGVPELLVGAHSSQMAKIQRKNTQIANVVVVVGR